MTALARSYARAFLETAASGYDVNRFLGGARAVEQALSADARLKAFFGAPTVPAEPKKGVLEELTRRVGLDDFGRRFFQVVLANRRILRIGEILLEIREESDRRRGTVAARVRVATPVGPAEEKKIAEALSRALGRTVRLQVEVDEGILAGFVARVGSEVFDASVLHAIERFREESREGAGA